MGPPWSMVIDQRHVLADRHAARSSASPPSLRSVSCAMAATAVGQILDPDGELHVLADEAEARRVLDDEAAVGLARLAGQQHVERRIDGEPVGRRHVVHLAVGDHHRAGDALARHVGERAGQRGVELRCRCRRAAALGSGAPAWTTRTSRSFCCCELVASPIAAPRRHIAGARRCACSASRRPPRRRRRAAAGAAPRRATDRPGSSSSTAEREEPPGQAARPPPRAERQHQHRDARQRR